MHIFWGDITGPDTALLQQDEYRHCVKVMRRKVGDAVALVDGQGQYVEGKITMIGKDNVQVAILKQVAEWGEHPGHIALALSPLRLKDRFEWAIEKAVELGVNEIFPLISQHTETQKARFKPERLLTRMRTAIKQCGRSRLPVLHPVQPFEAWLPQARTGPSFMAAMPATSPFQPPAWEDGQARLTLMIGPEGGFSPAEIAAASSQEVQLISLGNNRLRAETAAVYAISLVKQAWGF